MSRLAGFFSCVMLSLLVVTSWVEGYEQDVHLTLTKYLALWAGFSEADAAEIAKANQDMDLNPAFSAMPDIKANCLRFIGNECKAILLGAVNKKVLDDWVAKWKNDSAYQRILAAQRGYHFPDKKRLTDLRKVAFQFKNLKTFGHYLHALQDSFSHSIMDYSSLASLRDLDSDRLLASVGYLPDREIMGHTFYGHSADRTQDRPDLADLMARYVYKELVAFKGTSNRYAEIEATINRFVRGTDSARRDSLLTKLPGAEKPLPAGEAVAKTPELTFRMKDGSTVTGQLKDESIKIKSSVGTATVPVKDIVSFGGGELRLKDGNVLKGELTAASLAVVSKYGALQLNAKDMVWFGVGKPPESAAAAPPPQAPAAKPPAAAPASPAPAQPPTAAAPAPGPSQGGLVPQSYGVFVSSGGRLYELRQDRAEKGNYVVTYEKLRWWPSCCKNQIVQVPRSDSLDFIVHLRGLANPQVSLSQYFFVRKLLFSNWTFLIMPQEKKELRTPNTWIAVVDRTDLVQGPVQGQPEMTRVRFREAPAAGIYGLRIEAERAQYPGEGFLVFGIEDDLGATEKHCHDWRLEAGSEGVGSLKGLLHPCSADVFAGVQGGESGSRDPRQQQAAVAPEPRSESAPKTSAQDILPQIDQEDRARVARLPEVSRRYVTQRVVDGRAAMKKGNWKRARMEYAGIIVKYDPQFFEAHVNLSGIYAMLNELDNAKKHFDIARQRAPQYVIPYVNMVYAYARAGNVEEARKYLEKVVELGYGDLAKLGSDEDLPKEFREDPKVQQLVSKGG